MTYSSDEFLHAVKHALIDAKCWYVSDGAVDGTFQLALGERVQRRVRLQAEHHTSEYRNYEGTANLLVWCSWRLDSQDDVITSSDDEYSSIVEGLNRLIGSCINRVSILSPAWDLELQFNNEFTLNVFCDHVPGDPSYDGNWYLTLRESLFFAGPGVKFGVETRNDPTG